MSYMIYSVCTKNFGDAFNFVIDSWLRTEAVRIVIFTDNADWSGKRDRVEMVEAFDESSNWSQNAARKAYATTMVYGDYPDENIAFVDMDCYLRGDIGHVFEKEFDLAATHLERKYASNGVFFFKRCPRAGSFVERYDAEQKKLQIQPDGVKQSDYDQKAFTNAFNSVKGLKLINLPVYLYNRKISDRERTDEEKAQLENDNPFVLHFYNNSYRNERNRKEVLDLLGPRRVK